MLQHGACLYRLATPVHRGQPASNRKCVYKWGSYFYCFCHFTRSTSSLILSLSLSPPSFAECPPTFPTICRPPPSLLPGFVSLSMKVQKLAVRSSSFLFFLSSSSVPSPGFEGSTSPSGILLLWFYPLFDSLSSRQLLANSVPQKRTFGQLLLLLLMSREL